MSRGGGSMDLSSGVGVVSSSPADLRVRAEMWSGQVPVFFTLAPHEVTSMEDPPPLAMLVPRMSYFPLVLGEVRNHFRDMTPAMEDELWLEYDGVPLKWNIPIGVLFDLLCPSASSDESSPSTPSGSPHMNLPWRLVVHFQSFPLKRLTRCRTLFTVRQHFLNTWKESCYLRFSSSKIAMSCHPHDHQKMWDALTHLREDLHVATNARILASAIMGHASPPPGGQGVAMVHAALENKSVESLAIRVYVHSTRAASEEGANSEQHMCPIQRAMAPRTKMGHEHTLAHFVKLHLPALIDPASEATNANATANNNTAASTSVPASASSDGDSPAAFRLLPTVRLLVQGFAPPLSTPLSWLATYCAHPDGFLYLCVQLQERETEEDRAQQSLELGFGHLGHLVHRSSFGGGGHSGFGGLMHSVPGYHAATNAVNVVYQNLPSLPGSLQLPGLGQLTLPSVSSLFGGPSAAAPAPALPPLPQQTLEPEAEAEARAEPDLLSTEGEAAASSPETVTYSEPASVLAGGSFLRGGEVHFDSQDQLP